MINKNICFQEDRALTEFHGKFTSTAYKVWNYILYNATLSNDFLRTMEIHGKEIVDACNIKSNNWTATLKSVSNELRDKTIELKSFSKNEYMKTKIVDDIRYENGIMKVKIAEEISFHILPANVNTEMDIFRELSIMYKQEQHGSDYDE